MKQNEIYLQNLLLACEMLEAGFNKKCVHNANYFETRGDFDCYFITAYGGHCGIFNFPKGVLPKSIPLPTLGEIELPEGWAIGMCNGEFEIFYYTVPKTDVYHQVFENELEARAGAWLKASGKKETKI